MFGCDPVCCAWSVACGYPKFQGVLGIHHFGSNCELSFIVGALCMELQFQWDSDTQVSMFSGTQQLACPGKDYEKQLLTMVECMTQRADIEARTEKDKDDNHMERIELEQIKKQWQGEGRGSSSTAWRGPFHRTELFHEFKYWSSGGGATKSLNFFREKYWAPFRAKHFNF